MQESDLIAHVLIELSKTGARLFRQNTGVGWVGKIKRRVKNIIMLENARPLNAGLCVGSSDIIGWTTVTVTPEMVGTRVAIFTAIEVKTGKLKLTPSQLNFIGKVNEAGGIGRCYREGDPISDLLPSR